jgi:hypothetical protein
MMLRLVFPALALTLVTPLLALPSSPSVAWAQDEDQDEDEDLDAEDDEFSTDEELGYWEDPFEGEEFTFGAPMMPNDAISAVEFLQATLDAQAQHAEEEDKLFQEVGEHGEDPEPTEEIERKLEELQALQSQGAWLQLRYERALRVIQFTGTTDQLMELMAAQENPTILVELIVILPTYDVRFDPRVGPAMVAAARRLDGVSYGLLDAMASVGGEEIQGFLLEFGVENKSHQPWLRALRLPESTAVFTRLVELAKGDEAELAALACRTLESFRLVPQPALMLELEERDQVRQRLNDAQQEFLILSELPPALQVALIRYVGGLASIPSRLPRSLQLDEFEEEDLRDWHYELADHAFQLLSSVGVIESEQVNEALCWALGQTLLDDSMEILREYLQNPTASVKVKRQAISSLAQARYLPAGGDLLDLYDDEDLKRYVLRALQRIARRRVGDNYEYWATWWYRQENRLYPE